jgi:uncharacterized protein
MSEPFPSAQPWIDESIVVGASEISGRGLFATSRIEAGRVVVRLGGRLVSTTQLADMIAASETYVDTLTVYEDRHLVLPPGTAVHFGNHSCDPTLWHVGPYEIATRRQIRDGEELTFDYGTQSGAPGFSMPCSCGTPRCRRLVTSEDWRLPSLQVPYEGHWTPALAARIRSL